MSPFPIAAGRHALFAAGIFLALLAAPLRAEEDDTRFSATLRPEQWTETGLNKLSTDNVAVIDALVRADKAASEYRNNNIRSTRFSQRRDEHERTISGLYLLTPEQLQRLDNLVAVRIIPPTAQLEATIPSPRLTVEPVMAGARPPEMHGQFSLTYGWGKGGSIRGADATMVYDDPAHHFSLLFNYSEYRGKGYFPLIYPGAGIYPYYPAPELLPEH